MLKIVFDLLEKNSKYMSADVLWITDFKIPLSSEQQRKTLLEYRINGTKFYGLKIGKVFHTEWDEYFNEIVEVE